ncbi:hypothetical protein OAN307_c25460 [Octadecabacter antarcticus 307]|uniref:Uncharacterized protein n=2 Tax=Octadecabacter TaxID=53945 RepID=M9R8L8_9RHOB|nr:hypothetical protein OAN307_c25460 [Octadecabacter antarcticus 307]
MTTPLNTAKLGFLLPAILNPATAAVVGIGIGLLWLLSDDDDKEATVDNMPIKRIKPAVRTAAQPLPTLQKLPTDIELVVADTAPAEIPELDQKEVIRSAMSELGKLSAAARAKKKAERENEAG